MENSSNSTHQKQKQNGIKQTIQDVNTDNIAYKVVYAGQNGDESFDLCKTYDVAARRLEEIRTLRSAYMESTRFEIREVELNDANDTKV